MKTIKVEEVEEVDWISRLPDPILHHIFSYLPFTQVVQTSVLSKRWEKLWHTSPIFNLSRYIFDRGLRRPPPFDNIEINNQLQDRAKDLFSCLVRILQNSQCSIEKLSVEMDLFDDPEFRTLLDQCICYAIDSNVKELRLCFSSWISDMMCIMPQLLFSAISIEVLELEGCLLELPISNVMLPSLRKLCLACGYIDGHSIKNLVAGCPLLEALKLYSCLGSGDLEVFGFSRLNGIKLVDIYHFGRVVIKAPNVCKLSIVGLSKQQEISLIFYDNLRRLSLCNVSMKNGNWLNDHISKFPVLEYLKLDKWYRLKSLCILSPSLKILLISGCERLVKLNLGTPNLQFFDYQGEIISLSLNALGLSKINLHLNCRDGDVETQWYAKYVEFLANFQNISEVMSLQSGMEEDLVIPRELRQTLPSPLSSVNHLKLKLVIISNHMTISKFVDDLLWLAPHTRTMSIDDGFEDEYSFKFSFSYKNQVTYEGETTTCCKSLPISCWQHCIEEVLLEISDKYHQAGQNSKMYVLKGTDIMEQIDDLCVVAAL